MEARCGWVGRKKHPSTCKHSFARLHSCQSWSKHNTQCATFKVELDQQPKQIRPIQNPFYPREGTRDQGQPGEGTREQPFTREHSRNRANHERALASRAWRAERSTLTARINSDARGTCCCRGVCVLEQFSVQDHVPADIASALYI